VGANSIANGLRQRAGQRMPIGGGAEPKARAQAVPHPTHHACASFARSAARLARTLHVPFQDALPRYTLVPFLANTHAPFLAALTE